MYHSVRKAQEWAAQARRGMLSVAETSKDVTTTISKTLEYPLLAVTLSKEECHQIQRPVTDDLHKAASHQQWQRPQDANLWLWDALEPCLQRDGELFQLRDKKITPCNQNRHKQPAPSTQPNPSTKQRRTRRKQPPSKWKRKRGTDLESTPSNA